MVEGSPLPLSFLFFFLSFFFFLSLFLTVFSPFRLLTFSQFPLSFNSFPTPPHPRTPSPLLIPSFPNPSFSRSILRSPSPHSPSSHSHSIFSQLPPPHVPPPPSAPPFPLLLPPLHFIVLSSPPPLPLHPRPPPPLPIISPLLPLFILSFLHFLSSKTITKDLLHQNQWSQGIGCRTDAVTNMGKSHPGTHHLLSRSILPGTHFQ